MKKHDAHYTPREDRGFPPAENKYTTNLLKIQTAQP